MSCVRSSGGVGAGDQAQGWVACLRPVHLLPVHQRVIQERYKKYLVVGQRSLQEDQEQLQKEYVAHLEKYLRQRRPIGRHGSEKTQQRSDVPKRQHCRRYEDDKRQDHNTDTPFEFRHSQENNKIQTETQVCYAYATEEERNRQNQRSESGDSMEVTQKGAHIEFDFG